MATQLRSVTGSARTSDEELRDAESSLTFQWTIWVTPYWSVAKRQDEHGQQEKTISAHDDRLNKECLFELFAVFYIVDDDDKFKSVLIQLFVCLFASLRLFN